jgi:diadenosine tetraphosphate (Ap4A) HIT family hydrolase
MRLLRCVGGAQHARQARHPRTQTHAHTHVVPRRTSLCLPQLAWENTGSCRSAPLVALLWKLTVTPAARSAV